MVVVNAGPKQSWLSATTLKIHAQQLLAGTGIQLMPLKLSPKPQALFSRPTDTQRTHRTTCNKQTPKRYSWAKSQGLWQVGATGWSFMNMRWSAWAQQPKTAMLCCAMPKRFHRAKVPRCKVPVEASGCCVSSRSDWLGVAETSSKLA